MAPLQRIVGVALISSALGATLITILAALLRRRRKNADKKPDVLNEAHPLDLALSVTG